MVIAMMSSRLHHGDCVMAIASVAHCGSIQHIHAPCCMVPMRHINPCSMRHLSAPSMQYIPCTPQAHFSGSPRIAQIFWSDWNLALASCSTTTVLSVLQSHGHAAVQELEHGTAQVGLVHMGYISARHMKDLCPFPQVPQVPALNYSVLPWCKLSEAQLMHMSAVHAHAHEWDQLVACCHGAVLLGSMPCCSPALPMLLPLHCPCSLHSHGPHEHDASNALRGQGKYSDTIKSCPNQRLPPLHSHARRWSSFMLASHPRCQITASTAQLHEQTHLVTRVFVWMQP